MPNHLTLHRLELIAENGESRMEKVPVDSNTGKLGIEYGFKIRKINDTSAVALGWRTPDTAYVSCDEGPSGRVYAPGGFRQGNVAFVQIDDPMIRASQMDIQSIDSFLDSLGKAEAMQRAGIMEQYSVVGEITSFF